MSYQLYRNTTLGHTLEESLDELIQVIILVYSNKHNHKQIDFTVWTNNAANCSKGTITV